MKSNNLLNSFKYAFEGIKKAFMMERNLKIHISCMFIIIILGIILNISLWEWIICILLFSLVISSELINTAIEEVVNLLSLDIKPHAKYAKDIAAGFVLINAICSFIIGIIIFAPKIFSLFN